MAGSAPLGTSLADSLSLHPVPSGHDGGSHTGASAVSAQSHQLRSCPIPTRTLSSPQTKANPSRTQVLVPSCAMPFPMQFGGIYSAPILPHTKGCLQFNLGENQIPFDRHPMDWVGRWSQTQQQKHSPLLSPKVHANRAVQQSAIIYTLVSYIVKSFSCV